MGGLIPKGYNSNEKKKKRGIKKKRGAGPRSNVVEDGKRYFWE